MVFGHGVTYKVTPCYSFWLFFIGIIGSWNGEVHVKPKPELWNS